MRIEICVAGFGGQGVVSAGLVLAKAALKQRLNVSWLPSYGPEMRGGRASCTVVVSDEEIDSPLLDRPDVAVIMSAPALEKFLPLVNPGGVLLVNSSMVAEPIPRADLSVYRIPAGRLAARLGSDRVANMVMLGALLACPNPFRRQVPAQAVLEAADGLAGSRDSSLASLNRRAFRAGYALVRIRSRLQNLGTRNRLTIRTARKAVKRT